MTNGLCVLILALLCSTLTIAEGENVREEVESGFLERPLGNDTLASLNKIAAGSNGRTNQKQKGKSSDGSTGSTNKQQKETKSGSNGKEESPTNNKQQKETKSSSNGKEESPTNNKQQKETKSDSNGKEESPTNERPKDQEQHVVNSRGTKNLPPESGGEENYPPDPFAASRAYIKNGSINFLEFGIHQLATGKIVAWAKTEFHAMHVLSMLFFPFGVALVFWIWTAAWIFGGKVARVIRKFDAEQAVRQVNDIGIAEQAVGRRDFIGFLQRILQRIFQRDGMGMFQQNDSGIV